MDNNTILLDKSSKKLVQARLPFKVLSSTEKNKVITSIEKLKPTSPPESELETIVQTKEDNKTNVLDNEGDVVILSEDDEKCDKINNKIIETPRQKAADNQNKTPDQKPPKVFIKLPLSSKKKKRKSHSLNESIDKDGQDLVSHTETNDFIEPSNPRKKAKLSDFVINKKFESGNSELEIIESNEKDLNIEEKSDHLKDESTSNINSISNCDNTKKDEEKIKNKNEEGSSSKLKQDEDVVEIMDVDEEPEPEPIKEKETKIDSPAKSNVIYPVEKTPIKIVEVKSLAVKEVIEIIDSEPIEENEAIVVKSPVEEKIKEIISEEVSAKSIKKNAKSPVKDAFNDSISEQMPFKGFEKNTKSPDQETKKSISEEASAKRSCLRTRKSIVCTPKSVASTPKSAKLSSKKDDLNISEIKAQVKVEWQKLEDKIEKNESLKLIASIDLNESIDLTSDLDESVTSKNEKAAKRTREVKLTPRSVNLKNEREEKKRKEREEREEKLRKEREEREEKLRKEREEREEKLRKEREEREQKKLQEKLEKEEMRRKEKEEKEKKRLAEIEAKNEEKRLKEEERKKKEQQKEEEKRKREEMLEEARKKKEEEKKKKDEQREEERLKREEEKRKKELEKEEIENKKKKAAEKFTKFFVQSRTNTTKVTSEDDSSAEKVIEKFIPFQKKKDMRLAPVVRRQLNDNQKKSLVELLQSETKFDDSYLKELKNGKHNPLKGERTLPRNYDDDEIIIVDEMHGISQAIDESSKISKKYKAKYFRFCENRRPPYYGTWQKKSSFIKPRKPFGIDKVTFDYEVDSDLEWEEEEPGESISGSDDEKDKESEDDYEVDNEFFVPHGHLSEEELELEEDQSPEAQKAKLKILQLEFANEMKKKTEKLKPRLIGVVWVNKDLSKPDSCPDKVWEFLKRREMMFTDKVSCICPIKENSLENNSPSQPEKEKQRISKRTEFPEEYNEPLIKLVHGNTNKKEFIINEFQAYLLTLDEENPDKQQFTKTCIRNKIESLSKWKIMQDFNNSNKKVFCWVVSDDNLEKYNLTDLTIQNKWSYIIPPKIRKNDIKPSEPVVVEENIDNKQQQQQQPIKPNESSPAITKFTKVLTKEEKEKLLESNKTIKTNTTPKTTKSNSSKSENLQQNSKSITKKRVPILFSVPRGENVPETSKNIAVNDFLKKQQTTSSFAKTNLVLNSKTSIEKTRKISSDIEDDCIVIE